MIPVSKFNRACVRLILHRQSYILSTWIFWATLGPEVNVAGAGTMITIALQWGFKFVHRPLIISCVNCLWHYALQSCTSWLLFWTVNGEGSAQNYSHKQCEKMCFEPTFFLQNIFSKADVFLNQTYKEFLFISKQFFRKVNCVAKSRPATRGWATGWLPKIFLFSAIFTIMLNC